MKKKPSYKEFSDEELVQLSLKDQDCFYYLMKRYELKILRYMKRISNVSLEESEDILQEIFIKVYRNLNGFNPKLKFSSWIYRIAHNEIINQRRKNNTYSAMVTSNMEDDNDDLSKFVCDALNIDDICISGENAGKVRMALAELPDKYRKALVLRYLEDRSYNEISDILRKPPGTVATLINRAKLKFKKVAVRHQLESLI